LVQYLKEADLSGYDVVYVERIPLQDLNVPHSKIVLDMQDCYSLLIPQLASNAPGLRRWGYKLDGFWIRKYEAEACNRAEVILCTAEREARGLRSIGVTKPIEVILHSGHWAPLRRRKVLDRARKVLSFHGKLKYPPNMVALDTLHRDIFQKLNRAEYDVLVAGAGSDKLQGRYPQFRFAGYVEDILTHLRSADLTVLPVEISAGISNKALESLAAGIPVIATPQVAAGLPDSAQLCEAGIFVRSIDDFAGAIEDYFDLSREKKQEIADNCVEYIAHLSNSDRRREHLRRCIFGVRAEQCHGN
jgi:glycosyltransferase involved in cell wall biosynthesis